MKQESEFDVSEDEYEEESEEEQQQQTQDWGGFPTIELGGQDDDPEEPKKKKTKKSGGFQSMGLSYPVYKGVIGRGYKVPTPIQRKTIPLILGGLDIVAMARTGSGKTAAFLVPMLEKLKAHSTKVGIRAIVLSPTRELALQTLKFCKDIGKLTDLCSCLLVGGDSMEKQFEHLAQNPDILIATPGRLMHHLQEIKTMSLKSVEYIVFDEADRLFEMGFAEQLKEIMERLSDTRQTLLFSATLPKSLVDFARAGLKEPQLIRLDVETKISENLQMSFFTLRPEEKTAALVYLLRDVIAPSDSTIVFVATRHHVEYLNMVLESFGIESSTIYGSMDQTARKIAIGKFRNGKSKLLLVTDVAARGIDIPLLNNVVNFDFPAKPKLFVHRVGRAARAGRSGVAYNFLTPDELPFMLDLFLFLGKTPRNTVPEGEEPDPNECYYGVFPQIMIDNEVEKVRELQAANIDVHNMTNVVKNAYTLYFKTRTKPSSESVRRAKKMRKQEIHPSLVNKVNTEELQREAYLEHLKGFRPKDNQTALETTDPNIQKVMKSKRSFHEKIINKEKATAEKEAGGGDDDDDGSDEDIDFSAAKRKAEVALSTEMPTSSKKKRKSFKDEKFFMSGVPKTDFGEKGLEMKDNPGGGIRLEDAVLDLTAEDNEGLKKQKSQWRWTGKKYVRVNPGDELNVRGNKKIRTESGAVVIKKKGEEGEGKSLYEEWRAKQKKAIPMEGETESGQRRGGRFPKSKGNDANRNVRDELKSSHQIRKERERKERLASRKKGGKPKQGRREVPDHKLAKHSAPTRSKQIVRVSGGRGGRGGRGRGGKRR